MQALIRIAATATFALTSVTGVRLALIGGADPDDVVNVATLETSGASEGSLSAGGDASTGAAARVFAAEGASSDTAVRAVLPQGGSHVPTDASVRTDAADDLSPFLASADVQTAVATDRSDHLRSMTRTRGPASLDAQLQGDAGESAGASEVGGATELALRSR
jgi:hypothetical protein